MSDIILVAGSSRLALPAVIIYGRHCYQLVATARDRLELRAYEAQGSLDTERKQSI